MGVTKLLTEIGAEPTHILCHGANKRWGKAMRKMLDATPFGEQAEVHVGKDLWHMRSLVFTDRPDFMIGNSYGKYIQRDTAHLGKDFEVPLIRLGFPIFDRHHLHRNGIWGYEGAIYILTTLVNEVLASLDEQTQKLGETDYNFDLIR
jgi:nitrogenase molybdenum-iron protein beta chain